MRDTPRNFTNLVGNIKSDLGTTFNNLHTLETMIKVFAGSRPVPENPRIKELEKELQGYAQALSDLVPKNAAELNLECLLQFDSKGYLKMPDKLWVSGKFLRDKDSKQEPLECSARLKMHKDGEEVEDSKPSTSWSV